MIKRIHSNNNIDLLTELVKTNFILKYNGSILGFIWVLLKPFMQFTVLFLVFSNFNANKNIENFTLYLLIGIVLYSFVQESLMTGVHSLLEKAHIILKVNFDKTLAIYSTIILALINLFINLLIIVIFGIFTEIHPTPLSLLYFLGILFVSFIGLSGIAFFTSIITVRLRDLQHIVEVFLQILFYATPIIYQIDILPPGPKAIISKNPVFIIIQASREAIIRGDIAFLKEMMVLTIVSFIVFGLGLIFFKRNVKRIAEYF